MPLSTPPFTDMHTSWAVRYVVSDCVEIFMGPKCSGLTLGNLLRHAISQLQGCVLPPPEPGQAPMHPTASASRRAALHQPRKPRGAPYASVSGPWYCLIHGLGSPLHR